MPLDRAARAWLDRSMIARVATRSPGGGAFVTPLWFVVAGDRLLATTGAASVSVRNLRADPEVVLLCDADRGPREDRVLRLRGRATLHAGYPGWSALLHFARKYYLSPGGMRCELRHALRWPLRQRYYAQGRATVIEVAPGSAEWVARPS
jgi:nitroimidazol reductase NimA-like FMN-containing flavoprotein (pyridoxamine 5'-phosphate oxidase superfamily)